MDSYLVILQILVSLRWKGHDSLLLPLRNRLIYVNIRMVIWQSL